MSKLFESLQDPQNEKLSHNPSQNLQPYPFVNYTNTQNYIQRKSSLKKLIIAMCMLMSINIVGIAFYLYKPKKIVPQKTEILPSIPVVQVPEVALDAAYDLRRMETLKRLYSQPLCTSLSTLTLDNLVQGFVWGQQQIQQYNFQWKKHAVSTLFQLQKRTQRIKLANLYQQGSWINLPWHKICFDIKKQCQSSLNLFDQFLNESSRVVLKAQQNLLMHMQRPVVAYKPQPQAAPVKKMKKVSPHENTIKDILDKMKVYSIRVDGRDSKVNLDGQIYYPQTLVSQTPRLELIGIKQNELIFCDEHNKKYFKKISQ